VSQRADLNAMTAAPSQTVDSAEIAKFAALAAQWWNPQGPFAALHQMNPARLTFIRQRVLAQFGKSPAAPVADLDVLDLGCGGGLVSAPLARMGGQGVGLDAGAEAIGAARTYASQAGLDIDFRVGTAEDLAASGARFDLVVALEIIEHVADLSAFLAAAQKLVKPGGLLIVSTINRTPKARALALFAAERVLKWAPEGAHDYDKLVRPEEIRAAAPDLMWDEPVGISFKPLGAGWSLSSDVSMNYLMSGKTPF